MLTLRASSENKNENKNQNQLDGNGICMEFHTMGRLTLFLILLCGTFENLFYFSLFAESVGELLQFTNECRSNTSQRNLYILIFVRLAFR